jgi:hypothetical protein
VLALKRGRYQEDLGQYFRFIIPSFLTVLAPFCVLCYYFTGFPLPQSGTALHLQSVLSFTDGAYHYFHFFKVMCKHYWVFMAPQVLEFLVPSESRFFPVPRLLGLALLPLIPCLSFNRARHIFSLCQLSLRIAIVFGIVLLVAYLGYVGGSWFFPRYFHFFLIIGVILFAALLNPQLPAWGKTLVIGCITLYLAACSIVGISSRLASPFDMFSSQWNAFYPVRDLLGQNKKIGAFQSGYLAYATHGGVLNLDGKINLETQPYLRNGTIDDYIVLKKLDYIVEWPILLDVLMLNHVRQPKLKLVLESGGTGPRVTGIYRVVPISLP